MTAEHPLAWTALDKGTPILGADGDEIGKVSRVIADFDRDIFSGVTFRPGLLEGEKFVPARVVGTITDKGVHLTISTPNAEAFRDYEA
jgi:hypothetical protein